MCYTYFLRPNSTKPGTSVQKVRKPDDVKSNAFLKLCEYLEHNDECQYSLDELVSIMTNFEGTTTVYSKKHLKRKLEKHFGKHITIADISGRSGVVCFTHCVKDILSDEWYANRKSDSAEDIKRLIATAAELIRNDIHSRPFDCHLFPSAEQIISGNSDLVPESLQLLIDGILKPKENDRNIQRKSISIQHAVIAAVRPRSFVSPVQTGLSLHLHRKYGSRGLIDILSNLGFCSAYREVLNYEASVTVNSSTEVGPHSYIQFVLDNADYNVATIDGYKTFHSMEGIMSVMPAEQVTAETPIPRNENYNAAILESHGLFRVTTHERPEIHGYSLIKAENIQTLVQERKSLNIANSLNILWLCNSWLQDLSHPNWNGFMDRTYSKPLTYKASAILPLPFVSLNPSNSSTVYTCLLHAAEEGEKIGQSTTMVTFDQSHMLKLAKWFLLLIPVAPFLV